MALAEKKQDAPSGTNENYRYVDIINEIEEVCAVDEWRVGDTRIWPLLRVGLGFRLDTYAMGYVKDTLLSHGIMMLRDVKNYTLANMRDFAMNQSLRGRADWAFLTATTDRNVQVNGRWYDNHCDPLIEHAEILGHKSVLLEHSDMARYRVPRHSPSVWIKPQLNALATLSVLRDKTPDPTKWHGWSEMLRILEREKTGVGMPDLLNILRRYNVVRRWANYFKGHFARLGTRAGAAVSWYGPLGMAYMLACRESGMKAVDLQHGTAAAVHIGYGRWRRVPRGGYDMMPTHFWCWSDVEQRTLHEWQQHVPDAPKALVAGHTLAEIFGDSSTELSRLFAPELERLVPTNYKHILITLQAIGLDPVFEEIIKRAPKDWMFWVRAHPCFAIDPKETEQRLASGNGARWNLADASRLPLLALMSRMDVHLTAFSSTVVEADMFGVPSVMTHPNGATSCPEQVESGMAVEALDPDSAIRAIASQMSRRSLRQVPRRLGINATLREILPPR